MEDLVSFIIPAYNNENTIDDCIVSVLKQACKKEVIVVDNGSKDKTTNIIKKHPVRLIIEKKRGAAAARNRGLTVAKGNYTAFVDADAALPKGWAQRALRALKETNQNVVCARGPLLSVEKSTVAKALDALTFGRPRNVKRAYIDILNASGVMFDSKVLDEIKFDEEMIRGQDTEMGFRIIEKGYQILYDDNLYIYHHNPSTFKGILKRWYIYGKSYPLSYLKHKKMRGITFYGRLLYMPLLCLLIGLSFIWTPIICIVCAQLLAVFFSYMYVGMKIPPKNLRIDIITFSLIHTIKQLAQMTGIWFGIVERAIIKPN